MPDRRRHISRLGAVPGRRADPVHDQRALASPPLDRTTADASAQIVATSFSYTTRPTSTVWLQRPLPLVRLRQQHPGLQRGQTVNYDTSLATLNRWHQPLQFQPQALRCRHVVDARAPPRPSAPATRSKRSSSRSAPSTRRMRTRLRLSADALGMQPAHTARRVPVLATHRHRPRRTVARRHRRADVAAAVRYLRPHHAPLLRHRHRVPVNAVSLNGTVFVGRRQPARHRVRSADQRRPTAFSLGVDYVPKRPCRSARRISSRSTGAPEVASGDPGPQFEDPTRDWTTTGRDSAHTFTGLGGSAEALAQNGRPLRV